jgi:predicted dehydrogenase
MTMRPPLRIALAGAGRWGTNYLRTLSSLGDCELTGIVEPGPNRARAAAWSVPVFPSLDHLLARSRPDAVVIAAPDRVHARLAHTALEADCDVLVEKPLALSFAAAVSLQDLARARGRVLAVGQTTACHPGFRRLKADIACGAIGKPVRAESTRTSHGMAVGNPLQDLAPHSLALAIGLFGLPDRVSAVHEGNDGSFELDYPDGFRFAARVEWTSLPPVRRLVLRGATGTLELDETEPPRPGDVLPLTLLCEEFIAACRTRVEPPAGAELGVTIVACLESLEASARAAGAPIALEWNADAMAADTARAGHDADPRTLAPPFDWTRLP